MMMTDPQKLLRPHKQVQIASMNAWIMSLGMKCCADPIYLVFRGNSLFNYLCSIEDCISDHSFSEPVNLSILNLHVYDYSCSLHLNTVYIDFDFVFQERRRSHFCTQIRV